MDDYNRYVTAVNKIFDYTEKLKAGWNNLDNKNYIETIEDYKSVVTSKAELIKRPPTVAVEKSDDEEQEEELKIDSGKEETSSEEGTDDILGDIEDEPKEEEEVTEEETKEEEKKESSDSGSGQSEIRTFSSSNRVSGNTDIVALPGLPDFSNLTQIDEAPKIKEVEQIPMPAVPNEMGGLRE